MTKIFFGVHEPLYGRCTCHLHLQPFPVLIVKRILHEYNADYAIVFNYQHLIEVRRYDALKEIVERDFDTFTGKTLETYFRDKFIEEKRYTRIGGWWDKKNQNEVDLVCEDEQKQAIDFYEIKRDAKRYDMEAFALKTEAFFQKHPEKRNWKRAVACLSMENM